MEQRQINRVFVVGAGIMGSGIAQQAAQCGYEVTVCDIHEDALSRCRQTIAKSLERFMKKGTLTADDVETVQSRITYVTDLDAAAEADYVCEAIVEDLDAKREVFAHLDKITAEDIVLATNTSQFSITSIAAATKHRERVIGTHYFNPVVLMKLVEIIRGLQTSDETLATARAFNESLGKEVVVCKKDSAGFITTRLTCIQRVEAYRIYEEGIASPEDIDKAMRLAFNHPMGPFELADFAGLDTGLQVLEALADTYGERFKPPQVLRRMTESGFLGRKTGKGFYEYD